MLPDSANNTYLKVGQLIGHTGVIICMSITEDGKLASGGMDGVRLWDLQRVVKQDKPTSIHLGPVKQMGRPSGPGNRGATTALTWIRREDEPDDGLVFGTAAGYVVSWREMNGQGATSFEESYCLQLAKPGEITAIAFEASCNRLAVSNRNSVIQVFQVGPKLDLHCVFSVVVKNHVPKALAFRNTSESKELNTFGLYDGQIYTLSSIDGRVKEIRQIGCLIGNVTVNLRRGVFCIDDPSQGVALYRSATWDRIRTYPVKTLKSKRPRPVTFTEDCKFIVSGSDHGTVYVFDRRSGKMVDELNNGEGRIQAIAATEAAEMPLIFSAMNSGSDNACHIMVWKKKPKEPEASKPVINGTSNLNILKIIFHTCMILMAVAFLWQNLSDSIMAYHPFM